MLTMPKINLNSRINSTSFEALAAQFLNQSVKTNADVIHRNLEITSNAIIHGNLTIRGDHLIVEGTQTEIKDNIIVLNAGDVGNDGITLGFAGVQLYRGPSTDPYYLVFDEDDDSLKAGIGPNPSHAFDLVALRSASSVSNGLAIFNQTTKRFDIRDRIDVNLNYHNGLTFVSSLDSDVHGTFNVTGTSYLNFDWKLRSDSFVISNSQALYEIKASNTDGNLIFNYNNPLINNIMHFSSEAQESADGPLITTAGMKLHGRGTFDSEVNEHIFIGFEPSINGYSLKVDKSDSLLAVYRPLSISVGGIPNVMLFQPLPSLQVSMNAPLHITNETNATNYYTANNVASLKCAGGCQISKDLYVTGQVYVGSNINVPMFQYPSDYNVNLSNGVNIEPSTHVIASRTQIGNGYVSTWLTLGVYCSTSHQITSIDIDVPMSLYVFSQPFEADVLTQVSTESTQIFNVVGQSLVGTKRIRFQFNSTNNIDCHYIKTYIVSPYA